jgi:hypothetical protein
MKQIKAYNTISHLTVENHMVLDPIMAIGTTGNQIVL